MWSGCSLYAARMRPGCGLDVVWMRSGCSLDAVWMQSGCCPNHSSLFKSVSGHLSMVSNIQSYMWTVGWMDGWMGWRLSRLLRLLRAPNGAKNWDNSLYKVMEQ